MPSYYRGSSVYAMFPFVVPERNKEIMDRLGTAYLYDFAAPSLKPGPIVIRSFEAVKAVLENHDDFKVPCMFPTITIGPCTN